MHQRHPKQQQRQQQQQQPRNTEEDSSEREEERVHVSQRPIRRTLSTQSISRHVAYSPVAQHALSPVPPPSQPTHPSPIQSQATSPPQRLPDSGTYLSPSGFPTTVLHNPHAAHPQLHYHPTHQHPQLHLSPAPHPSQIHHSPPTLPIAPPPPQHRLQLSTPYIQSTLGPQNPHPHDPASHRTHPQAPPQPSHSAPVHTTRTVPPPQQQPHAQTHSPYAAGPIHYYPGAPSRQVMMPPPPGTAYYPIPTYHMEPVHLMTYYPAQYAYPQPNVSCESSCFVPPQGTPPGAHMRISKNPAASSSRRKRLKWTDELHRKFLAAIEEVGPETAVPKTLMQSMNVPGLTRENIASHLQKYRMRLKEQQAAGASDDTSEAHPAPPPTSSSGRSDRQDKSPGRNSSSQHDPSGEPVTQDSSSSREHTSTTEQHSPPHAAPP